MSMGVHQQAFREEAFELLGELESALLELEKTPGDMDLVNRVFRAMHTIKGAGGMFGYDDISTFTHEVETVMDRVRHGAVPVSKDIINLTLSARDHVLAILHSPDGKDQDHARRDVILKGFRKYIPEEDGGDERAQPAQTADPHEKKPEAVAKVYRIRFKPMDYIFRNGTNPLLLLDELRGMGDTKIFTHTDQLPPLREMDPENCYLSWDILLTTTAAQNVIREVFMFVEDDCDLQVRELESVGSLDESACRKLGEILIERGDITAKDIERVLAEQKKIGELLVESGVLETGKVKSALMEQQHIREMVDKKKQTDTVSSIRVPSQKLDDLVDLVGELVTLQARLSQTALAIGDSSLYAVSEEVERLTVELRDNTMSIRMLPIGTAFSKFQRMVRDLSAELGKEVEVSTEGEETELDKTVIEKLNDPLIHLIRNCIDHGIEKPADREKVGKPRKGLVQLKAMHSGANVLIKVMDDGKGLDAESIKAKGVATGIVPPGAELSEREVFNLIFAPGFSMAERVTSVSGRGVGMDVVKRNIDALGGAIEVESAFGAGTTISLKLPLTLAIIEGFLVRVMDDFFVFPLIAVEECVELRQVDIDNAHGRHIIRVRGEIVPYIRLREHFHMEGGRPQLEQIVIANVESRRIGFAVDHVIGGLQTVIKSLGRVYRNFEGLAGATILGDGTIALIIDLPKIVQQVK